ncbi:hypothetical protein LSH36_399g05001 [Paralvinella palmiformis]|uniref:Hexosyltransferase n=1 Tax=Paralvinella palmiformis TaxID=53620 RepID=A0AAD9N0J7_9ANNE|nr:hypothetical protein LSH36_399g05001 [Paralvinella palmiformis]
MMMLEYTSLLREPPGLSADCDWVLDSEQRRFTAHQQVKSFLQQHPAVMKKIWDVCFLSVYVLLMLAIHTVLRLNHQSTLDGATGLGYLTNNGGRGTLRWSAASNVNRRDNQRDLHSTKGQVVIENVTGVKPFRGRRVAIENRLNAEIRTQRVEILRGPHRCRQTSYLIIVVCSAADHFRHRDIIRRTWASGGADSVESLFVVGLSEDPITNKLVKDECSLYDDMMLVNILESYGNLTLKSVAILYWMKERCHDGKYLLKVDDDTVVNVPKLVNELRRMSHRKFIMGDIIGGARPVRNKTSKWYTPEALFRSLRYPDYVSGSAYVISGDLIGPLYEATQMTPSFWLEDVFVTGMCGSRVNATLIHNSRFKSFVSFSRHSYSLSKFTVLHRVGPEQLVKLWQRHNNNNTTEF